MRVYRLANKYEAAVVRFIFGKQRATLPLLRIAIVQGETGSVSNTFTCQRKTVYNS